MQAREAYLIDFGVHRYLSHQSSPPLSQRLRGIRPSSGGLASVTLVLSSSYSSLSLAVPLWACALCYSVRSEGRDVLISQRCQLWAYQYRGRLAFVDTGTRKGWRIALLSNGGHHTLKYLTPARPRWF